MVSSLHVVSSEVNYELILLYFCACDLDEGRQDITIIQIDYIHTVTREYSIYRVVTTSRLKAPIHLVVHDNLKTYTKYSKSSVENL